MLKLAPLLFALLVSASAARAGDGSITLIGVDSLNNVVTRTVPTADYSRQLALSISAVHDSILPVMTRRQETAGQAWLMRTIAVGVAFTGVFGLGPIWHYRVATRVRLVFSNSLNPPYPNL